MCMGKKNVITFKNVSCMTFKVKIIPQLKINSFSLEGRVFNSKSHNINKIISNIIKFIKL